MSFSNSILARFLFRALVVWCAGILVIGLVVGLAWRQTQTETGLLRRDDILHYYQEQIDRLNVDWQLQARRLQVIGQAEVPDTGPSSWSVLADPALIYPFALMRVLDDQGHELGRVGQVTGVLQMANPDSHWAVEQSGGKIYRVYREPLAGRANSSARWLILYAPLTVANFSQAGYPDVLTRVYRAGAADGVIQSGHVEQIILPWDPHDPDSPRLRLDVRPHDLPFRAIFLQSLLATILFSLFAWLYLGRWISYLAGLLRLEREATQRFNDIRQVDDQVFSLLAKVIQSPDEMGRMADSLLHLMREIELERRQREQLLQQLELEKERAEVTLSSIGDGVITTDASSRVTFLNRTAEMLTGWSLEDARGKHLDEVFNLVDEATRLRMTNLLDKVFDERGLTGQNRQAILVARNGAEFVIEELASPILSPGGAVIGCVLVFHDNTERSRLEQHAHWLAGHDVLTGLPNRVLLADRMNQAIAVVRRSGRKMAVGFLDLDHFKPINDRYGHELGDNILMEVARRIETALRADDTVARIGGDEFILILNGIQNESEVRQILDRLLENMARPIEVGRQTFQVSASVGVVVHGVDGLSDADLLLRQADQAMYIAKQSGRNCLHFFNVAEDAEIKTRHQQIERIQYAVQQNELRLHYQPKINMRTGEVVGLEALIRWQHPERGLLAPGHFLPQVEHTSLIVDIGEWVFEEVLRQIAAWHGEGAGWFKVSINLSGRQLMQPNFVQRVRELLSRHSNVSPHCIEFEILETESIEDFDLVSRVMRELRSAGVRFSIDDFGTGYSSLNFLKHLPVDMLKIDQAFVRDMLNDANDLALVEAVVSLSRVFHREVIAEGVESIEHGYALIRLGCDLAQGYGIARPMPAQMVPLWVAQNRENPTWSLWQFEQWEMTDFQLLVARHDHIEWVNQILRIVEGVETGTPDDLPFSSSQCRFGNWLHTLAQQRYGHLDVLRAIDELHEDIHRYGKELVHLVNQGQRREANIASQHFRLLRDRMLVLLAELQATSARSQAPSQNRLFV